MENVHPTSDFCASPDAETSASKTDFVPVTTVSIAEVCAAVKSLLSCPLLLPLNHPPDCDQLVEYRGFKSEVKPPNPVADTVACKLVVPYCLGPEPKAASNAPPTIAPANVPTGPQIEPTAAPIAEIVVPSSPTTCLFPAIAEPIAIPAMPAPTYDPAVPIVCALPISA